MSKVILPRLFHIGTQRAGSSYLNNLLRTHPQVSLASRQEVDFYNDNFERGVCWYADFYKKEGVLLDTSPRYFVDGKYVVERIAKCVGGEDPRFSLTLRDPIDYLYSLYKLKKNYGALKKEYLDGKKGFVDLCMESPEFISNAKYYNILSSYWFKHFPKTSFHIIDFDKFKSDANGSVSELLEFYGLRDINLQAPASSKNSTYRHPAIFRAKNVVVKSDFIKKRLKKSPLFNLVYNKFLISNDVVSGADRDALIKLLRDDVSNLKELYPKHNFRWVGFD